MRGHGFRIAACRLVGAKTYGQEMVSTPDARLVEVDYAPGAPQTCPRGWWSSWRVASTTHGPFYSNEVRFYARLRPDWR